jgi:uncharacterized lipoprotein YddW (UPF0748 family)
MNLLSCRLRSLVPTLCVGLLVVTAGTRSQGETGAAAPGELPPMQREFRAAWVATVANIDWPSKPGLTAEQQQAEMLALLDAATRLNLNAIILQVRPCCDAMYKSELEPWSEFLTGKMGEAPAPAYDPLEFAVNEAHRRGLELHAWFNPYRARHAGSQVPAAANHIGVTHPEVVKQYGRYTWMDPGEPVARDHTLAVIRDVVQRYDVDGVHMDDYFYPYPEQDAQNAVVSFPDDPSWQKAVEAGTQLSRDDWRRENINQLVQQIQRDIHKIKPWVKFGISPFGICRPGKPKQVVGFDQYESLYADAEKWYTEGWVDYLTPQLYWKIGPPQQSYAALLHWWSEQNKAQRHLWPGNYTSRLLGADNQSWSADELLAQIWVTRAQQGATGNVHFSMKALQQNAAGIADALVAGPYREPALVPESPWLKGPSEQPPQAPQLRVKKSAGKWVVSLDPAEVTSPWQWVIRTKAGDGWKTEIVPGGEREHPLAILSKTESPQAIAVTAMDRIGRESPPAWYRQSSR